MSLIEKKISPKKIYWILLGLGIITGAEALFSLFALSDNWTVKDTVIALYYVFYLCLEKWSDIWLLTSILTAIVFAIFFSKTILCSWKELFSSVSLSFLFLFLNIAIYVNTYQTIPQGSYEVVLHIMYIFFVFMDLVAVGNFIKFQQNKWLETIKEKEQKVLFKKINWFLVAVLFISMIPILYAAQYAYPQADDYSFGYHCHIAWVDTHSLFQVIKAAVVMILEAYFDWQGSFSSIFLMSLQPSVFSKSYYFLTTWIMIFVLAISTWYFIKTLLKDIFGIEKSYVFYVFLVTLLISIQYIPSKACAFYWFNGATHYIIAHGATLLFMAAVLRGLVRKNSIIDWIIGAVSAFYVGGTNYVTIVTVLFVILTIIIWLIYTKAIRKKKEIIYLFGIYLISFILNVIAPGNFLRMQRGPGAGLLYSFPLAFFEAVRYIFQHYMHWSVWIFIFAIVPVFVVTLQKVEIKFPNPVFVFLYSWCFMASMFYTPLFTIGNVDVGRFQNIIYLCAILCVLVNTIAIVGWVSQKKLNKDKNIQIRVLHIYSAIVLSLFIMLGGLSYFAEPQKNTSFLAIRTLLDGTAKECHKVYLEDINILESLENTSGTKATIYQLPYSPELFMNKDIETWSSGLRLFYRIDEIEIIPWENER